MNAFTRPIAVGILVLGCGLAVAAQQTASVPISKKKAFVIEFNAPYTVLVVDMDADDAKEFIDSDAMAWSVTGSTTFAGKDKKKPLDPSVIRRGMEVELTGSASVDGKVLTTVKLLTDPAQWKDEVNGYLESVEGDIAWVDGRRVRLAPGVSLMGPNKQVYTAFAAMPGGLHLNLKGNVSPDGILVVTGGSVEPNRFGPTDVAMFRLARASGALPPMERLAGGKAIVGGREVTFSNNFELQAYVTRVGNRLVPQYTRDLPDDFAGKLAWRFSVIEDESFNAFAMPDGAVFVHTGLLKQIKNEAQLAAVLGHEIAHATHEHARKKYEKEMRMAFLGSVLGPFVQGVAGDMGNLALGLTMLGIRSDYSRDREAQSDRVGLYYMTKAGYDPREAPRVWSAIAKENKRNEPLLMAAAAARGQQLNLASLPLFGSHPQARTRVKNLSRMIAQNYHDVDYRTLKVGEKEYMDVVGAYFGWVKGPANPGPAGGPTGPGSTPLVSVTSAVPVQTAPTAKSVTGGESAAKFAANEAIRRGVPRGAVYIIVRSGINEYFVNIASKTVTKTIKLPAAAYREAGEYAEVGLSVANAQYNDIGRGGSVLLKRSGNTWVVVTSNDGNGYDCAKINAVPANVRSELNLECGKF